MTDATVEMLDFKRQLGISPRFANENGKIGPLYF